ncbi:MAG TPA: hypothetical protein VGK32_15615 [Vicinamibacterales bacterium]|jgi:hypothetical protein
MAGEIGEVRLLRRIFFRRFFDNDLVAPNGGGEEKIGFVYAALAVPGLLAAAPLLLKYMNAWITPGQRLLIALDDKLTCVSISMIVMGIATLVEWDALVLDARDVAVVGPLPISRRTLLVAKMQALGLFVMTFAVAVNAIPSVLYPAILLGTLQVGLGCGVWLMVTHAGVSLAAGAFGFFVVLACRETLAFFTSARAFRRLSVIVQSALVLLFVTALLLVPARPSVPTSLLPTGGRGVSLSPPMWFLGLYETLTSRMILDSPGVVAPNGRQRWSPEAAEHYRRAYLAHMPTFERLAATAASGLGLVMLVAVGGYAFETRRLARRLPEPRSVLPRPVVAAVTALLSRTILRDPLSGATFFFTLQTLVRGAGQRMYLAGGAAVALATLIVFVPASDLHTLLGPPVAPSAALLTVQLILVCAAVGTVRFVSVVPADLRANWVFQTTWMRDPGASFAGVRRAAWVVGVVPVVALVPVHALVWGGHLAAVHLLFGVVAAALVVEWAFLNLRSLPFTCAGDSGRSRSSAWHAGLTAFLAAVPLGWLEHWAMESPDRAGIVAGVLGLGVIGLAFVRTRSMRRWCDVVFEEPFEPATQRLGVSSVD